MRERPAKGRMPAGRGQERSDAAANAAALRLCLTQARDGAGSSKSRKAGGDVHEGDSIDRWRVDARLWIMH